MKRIKLRIKNIISSILIIFLIMMNVNTFIEAFAKTEDNEVIKNIEQNNIMHVADKSTVDDYKKDMQSRTI